jgi:hypothetical protein
MSHFGKPLSARKKISLPSNQKSKITSSYLHLPTPIYSYLQQNYFPPDASPKIHNFVPLCAEENILPSVLNRKSSAAHNLDLKISFFAYSSLFKAIPP